MIRKGIIIVLTAATMLTFVAYVASSYRSFVRPFGSDDATLIAVAIRGAALVVTTMTITTMPGQPAEVIGARIRVPRSFTPFADKPVQRNPFFLPKFRRVTFPGGQGGWADLVIPLWIPFIIFAAFPTIALVRGPLRRWRRRLKGQCIDCGYDLTGNESGVCSECGSKIGAHSRKEGPK